MKSLQFAALVGTFAGTLAWADLGENEVSALPENVRTVLANSSVLEHPRGDRLPLWILPISGQLSSLSTSLAEACLRELDDRGIGYTVNWSPGRPKETLAEGLRIGRIQQRLGLEVGVNANACLYSFFDGSEETLHVDDEGNTFTDESFGRPLGCPFALRHRYPAMKERLDQFLRGYQEAGIEIDFIFADWEIDGPIEWNEAREHSQRCRRCREQVPNLEDFRVFQRAVRQRRSEMQRIVFADTVRARFPQALVGNYGVYPHEGHRYWYDYFEKEAKGAPYREDGKAKYREWYPEFPETGYTFAMPVVYTWYPTFDWYDFADTDYRWFYNMLLVGSSVGKSTPAATPIIPFVHWHTTAPPQDPDPRVEPFSAEAYQDLLWHLLLRGHDTFFLWCLGKELGVETKWLHQVYRESMAYSEFLSEGEPVSFEVPEEPNSVISGMRLGDQVLVKRSDFGSNPLSVSMALSEEERIRVPAGNGLQVLTIETAPKRSGLLMSGGERRFPIGIYELPREDEDLAEMARAGFNLFRCGNQEDLDRVQNVGAMGWVSLSVQSGATAELRQRITDLVDHPALAVWEGPDEIVWTYTAYSFLEKVAGFTRQDWSDQKEKAVQYARQQGGTINAAIHAGIQLVRELDPLNRPFWINEAADSDVFYARETVDSVDIVGCDYYAVRSTGTDLQSVGRLVQRWDAIGRGRPVWMVLQGFSWHAIRPERALLYPSFMQSRFMAYDSIVHGATGILYWGTNTIDDPAFRTSLGAAASELSALEPMLVAESLEGAEAKLIDDLFDPAGLGVRVLVKQRGTDIVVLLVNEDPQRHLGVDVTGLESVEGRTLHLLYGDERRTIRRGGFVTRMQPFEVKVFATNPIYQTSWTAGRAYVSPTR